MQQTSAEMEVGDVVNGRYRVEELLGSGAMGSIYRSMDVDLERPCCLKVLKEDHRDVDLRIEARALASIRHENVVSVYELGRHGDIPFIAMEYVRGKDLGWVILEHYGIHRSPVPSGRAVQLLRSLCDGLSAVHGAGILHRDIKPSNVILEDRTGRAVLVDFGAAVSAAWEGATAGTPNYMAPETFRGAPPSVQTDLYSLGCLAFELLTGALPYEAEDLPTIARMHQRSPIPRVSAFRPELAMLDEVFDRILHKDPSHRPTSAATFGNQLEDRLASDRAEPMSEVITPTSEGIRILVVDDDSTFARMAARCAQVAFADVHVSVKRVGTGAAAIESALRRRPDLVILDYLLPDATGVDVLSHLRAQGGHHAEAVIASGALGAKERWRFQILGVSDFVDKPVEFPALVSLVHRIALRRAWIRA